MFTKSKLTLVAFILIATLLWAQTHVQAVLDVAQTWTALQTFTSGVNASTLLAAGIVDGTAPTTLTTNTSTCQTGSHCALGGTYKSGYTFNNFTAAATQSFYDLPSVANTVAGMQYCVTNGFTAGPAPVTGAISVTPLTTASIAIAGTVGTANHAAVSGGAAGDSACFVAVDTTHWIAYVQSGTWTTP